MAWDGIERRTRGFCEAHLPMREDIIYIKTKLDNIDKRINGSIDDIHQHIEESNKFREMILTHDVDIKNFKGTKMASILTLTGVIGLIVTAIWWGGTINRQIEINTKRLDRIELYEKKGVTNVGINRINS
jgi:hypothetical protein